MTVFNLFAIATNAFTTLVCSAIAILLLSQLRRDKKSQFLLRLMLSLAASRFVVIVMRFVGATGANVHDLFVVATALTASSPYFLYRFVIEYFDAWTKRRRLIERGMLITLVALGVALGAELLLHTSIILEPVVFIASNSSVQYEYGPLIAFNVIFILYDELVLGTMFYTIVQLFRRDGERFSRRVAYGIGSLTVGMIIIPIPNIDHLAFEQNLYALGSLILIAPVLGQRLFDPLSQLNRSLRHRAQQMALITKVGNQAHALLSLGDLLPAAASEICQSFGYASVQIAVYDARGTPVEYAISYADGRVFNSAAAAEEPTQPRQRKQLLPIEIELPMTPAEGTLNGTMKIEQRRDRAIGQDERDVLDILARQIALAIHNAQLFEEVQRANAAKTTFISFVSHELRNGVGDVIALADSLLRAPEEYENMPLPAVHRPDVDHIFQSGLHLKRLLDDVVDWGQIESGRMRIDIGRVAPALILHEVAQQATAMVKVGVEVKSIYPSLLPDVQADPTRLKQVLMNLVGNAVKFTASGSITLDAREMDGFLQVSVADTGPGISKQAQSQLFQAYAQESRRVFQENSGNGLGLSISKQFIQMQDGKIWAESEEGKGSTFYFTIPLAD